jgi:hypothetical protein
MQGGPYCEALLASRRYSLFCANHAPLRMDGFIARPPSQLRDLAVTVATYLSLASCSRGAALLFLAAANQDHVIRRALGFAVDRVSIDSCPSMGDRPTFSAYRPRLARSSSTPPTEAPSVALKLGRIKGLLRLMLSCLGLVFKLARFVHFVWGCTPSTTRLIS